MASTTWDHWQDRCLARERFAVALFEQSSFNIPQLSQFMGRAKQLRSPHQTSIKLSEAKIAITHGFRLSPRSPSSGNFELHVSYDDVDVDLQMPASRQLSAVTPRLAHYTAHLIVVMKYVFLWLAQALIDHHSRPGLYFADYRMHLCSIDSA